MLVILKENVENVGQTGDVVKVSDGFARNYLLPKKLVLVANKDNLEQMAHHKKVFEKKREAQKAKAVEFLQKLEQHSCTIVKKTGEKDKLFGSVGANDIAIELKKAGLLVEKRQIQLDEPIKALGVHTVSVRLQPEVTAKLKVWVVKEGQS